MSYNAESIESLDYFEHIRRYPGMYIGSKDAKGLLHCVKEIVSNSIDEYLNGSCTNIDVIIKKDGGIEIKDNGRGIPHGLTKAGYTALFACFGVQSSGGKFNNATGESGYNTSGGEHGTGAKAVNALSKKLIVSTSRDGEKQTIEFNTGNIQGKFIGRKQCENLLSSLLHGCKKKVNVLPWLETNPTTNKPSLIGFKLKINF